MRRRRPVPTRLWIIAPTLLAVILTTRAAASRSFPLAPDQPAIGEVTVAVARPGETVADVARRADLGFTEVMAANPGLDPEGQISGARVVLPGYHILPDAPREGVVINLAAQRLFYFEPGRVLTFPIGVALAGHETPLGTTRIVAKQRDPVWRPTATIRADQPWLAAAVPPGPDNPLGTAALYLGWPAYLIHGTNRPEGVGRSGSYGCLSLYPEDITALFAAVPVGTPVRVLRQDTATVWGRGRLSVQIYPNEEQGYGLSGARGAEAVTVALRVRVLRAARQHGIRVDEVALSTARWDRSGLPVTVGR